MWMVLEQLGTGRPVTLNSDQIVSYGLHGRGVADGSAIVTLATASAGGPYIINVTNTLDEIDAMLGVERQAKS